MKRFSIYLRDNRSDTVPLIFFSAFLSMFIAFINGFPLVTSDTGAYVCNAYYFTVPHDRPLTYSLFIWLISLHKTLWLVIAGQSIWLSFFLVHVMKEFVPREGLRRYWLLFFIQVFTCISWYSSQLMPDLFTAVLFLSSILFLLSPSIKMKRISLISVFVCMLMHNSNMITGLIFSLILLPTFFIPSLEAYRKKTVQLVMVALLSWITMCGFHFMNGYGFRPSRSAHVFLIAKMSENGILKRYLDEHCHEHHFRLCDYKDVLPKHAWDFIWNDGGVLSKTGGWDSSRKEYSELIYSTLTTPKYLRMHGQESWKATMEQVTRCDIGDGIWPYPDGTNPYWKIQELFRLDHPIFKQSLQNRNQLTFESINLFYRMVILFSTFLAICFFFYHRKKMGKLGLVYVLALLFILLNAFTTATFANILSRLNSRAIWLWPAMNFILLFSIPSPFSKPKPKSGNVLSD